MNGIKTVLLLGALSGILLAFGYYFDGQSGLVFALVIAAIMNVVSYWFSDKIVLSMYRAREIQPAQDPGLYSIVSGLASSAGIPVPRVYIIDLPVPNAFATGRNPSHAAVAVTSGIRGILTDNELRAVLAHELGHVRNRDILISTVAATIASAISTLANFARWGGVFVGEGNDRRNGQNIFSLLALTILTPIIALIIQLAISRSREYAADESGAKLTGAPLDLANALRKIEMYAERQPLMGTPRMQPTASLFIINPFGGNVFARLFSTHPPIEERIARLEGMARGRR